MGTTKTPANIVGKQVQKRRKELDLTQEKFAIRCQLQGFDVSRGTISQIEASLRRVTDFELQLLADALETSISSLFPGRPEVVRKRKARTGS